MKIKHKELFFLLSIAVIVFAVFSLSVNYKIFNSWDDATYVLNNSHLNLSFENFIYYLSAPYNYLYTPFTMYTYMIDYALWGYSSTGYHIQNILWHILAVIAVFKCFRYFNLSQNIAFLISLIFALHPQRVESVVWIAERKDVVCAALYLWCIYFYMKSSDGKRYSYLISFILYILALMAKPMAISIPFVLLVFEFYKNRKINIKPYISKLGLYFVLLIIFIPLTYFSQAVSPKHFIFMNRVLIVFYNIAWYVKQTLLPWNINPVYPILDIKEIFYSLIFIYTGFICLLIILYKKNKIYFSVIFMIFSCYLFVLAPVSGFVPFGTFNRADRWSYIPSVFILFGIALLISEILKNKKFSGTVNFLIYIFIVLYIIILTCVNIDYQKQWENRIKLFTYSSCMYPANRYALVCLANLEMSLGNWEKVLELANKLENQNAYYSDNANKISNHIMSNYYIAFYYDSKNEKVKAFKKLKYLEPLINNYTFSNQYNFNQYYSKLASYYFQMNNISDTIKYLNILLTNPKTEPFYKFFYEGLKQYYLGNYNKAIYFFNEALKISPDDENSITNIYQCKQKLNNVRQ